MIFPYREIPTGKPAMDLVSHSHRGFTLIELLIVLVIVGISISLLAPDMYSLFKRVQVNNEISRIKIISQLAIEKSFFSNSKLELSFSKSKLELRPFSPQTNNESESDSPPSEVIRSFNSEFFSFNTTKIIIDQGKWLGVQSVNVSDSPFEELVQLELITCSTGRDCK